MVYNFVNVIFMAIEEQFRAIFVYLSICWAFIAVAILVPSALSVVYENLIEFTNSPRFWRKLAIIFGTNFDRVQAKQLQQQWQKEDFRQLPTMRILDQDMAGLLGSHAQSTDIIPYVFLIIYIHMLTE